MASIVDAFQEAFHEDFAYLKFIIYSIPVNFVVDLYMKGKMDQFEFWGFFVGMFLLGLLTAGINNVRMNKREILTFNPLHYLKALQLLLIHRKGQQLSSYLSLAHIRLKALHQAFCNRYNLLNLP